MKESTAEILRQLELDSLRLQEFRRRLEGLKAQELIEISDLLVDRVNALTVDTRALLGPLMTVTALVPGAVVLQGHKLPIQ